MLSGRVASTVYLNACYGAAGEQYSGWNPIGKSPEFTVKEKGSGAELARAVFAGST